MNLLMIFRTAWRSLTVNKMRSMLTALGIIIGVASVILMVSLGQGATAGITERISSMGTNILMVSPSGGRGGFGGTGASSLSMEDTEAIALLPYVKNVAPVAETSTTVAAGSTTWNATINGTAEDDFRIMDSAELRATVEDTTRILTLLLGGIAAVSLLVGGIGVMNIMLVSVTERTREIGIRMAVGATTHDILNHFMIESILLCLMGGAIGSGLGWGLSQLFASLSGWSMQVPAWSAIVAIAFSTLIGIIFGYYPARKAAEANPIEALRYE